MKANAEIIARKERFGPVAEWKGDPRSGVATMCGRVISDLTDSRRIPVGLAFKFGGLRLRVVEFPVISSTGVSYRDEAHVMLDSPIAELRALYVRAATRLLRGVCNLEARVSGFMLQEVHGREMKFTSRLADRIL